MAINVNHNPNLADYGSAIAAAAERHEQYSRAQAYADYIRRLRADDINRQFQQFPQRPDSGMDFRAKQQAANEAIEASQRAFMAAQDAQVKQRRAEKLKAIQESQTGLSAYGGQDAMNYAASIDGVRPLLQITRPQQAATQPAPTPAAIDTRPYDLAPPIAPVRSVLKKK